jgi:pimeloyl-ACP methyl ester carboxylesterase
MLYERRWNTGSLEVNVAEGPPAGPPLVLLHGVVRCWQDFLPVFPGLIVRWRLYGIDHRGHGRSQRHSEGAYRVTDYAADAAAVVQTLDEPAVIWGHSLGSLVALATAAAAPSQVRALVLEDPPLELLGARIEQSAYCGMFAQWQELTRRELSFGEMLAAVCDTEVEVPGSGKRNKLSAVRDATSLRFTARCLMRLDPEVFTPLVAGEWMTPQALADACGNVTCPTLVLAGNPANGGMCHERDETFLREHVRDVSFIRLPALGHLIHTMAPDQATRLVSGFLEPL